MSVTGRGRWALSSARVVAGAALAIGSALAVGTLATVPVPGHTAAPVAVEASPTPSDAVAVCAGPILATGRSTDDAAALGAAATEQLVAATGSGAPPASVLIAGPAPDGPIAYVMAPEARQVVEVAAAGSASVDAADLRGFAAAACRAPLFESWLVAGSAATGASDLVVLANPGATAATVAVTVYGTGGAVTAPGGGDVVVGPGAQVTLPLAGLRFGEAVPVVRVTATGAPVAAVLQSSITRTLLPGGVEQTNAVAAPGSTVVIPGVVVPDGIVPGSEPATVLRVLAPSADGTAAVSLVRADGVGTAAAPASPAAPATPALTVPLLAGQPVEVDLGTLDPGVWAVEVDADVAVTAAVRQSTGFAEGADFAWFEAAPPLTGVTLAAVAAGPAPTLALANPSPETITVTVTVTVTANGAATEIDVPAAGTVAVPVASGSILTLDAGAGVVHAAVVYSGAGALSGYALPPGGAASAAITVHP